MARDIKDLQTLYLMEKHEKKLSELYHNFSLIFTQCSTFWKNISDDELIHASWIDIFNEDVKSDLVGLAQKRFNAFDLKDSLHFLDEKIKKIQTEGISLEEAFKMAIQYEKSMLESKYLFVYKDDDPRIQELFAKLLKSTETHAQMIQEKYDEITAKN